MARPTIRTPEIIMKLEEAFSLGSTDSSACFYAGIGESTYYKWCEDDEELRERMKALKDKPIMIALRKVTEELSEDINTAKWYLERKHPDFKPKQDIVNTNNNKFDSDYMKKLNEAVKSVG